MTYTRDYLQSLTAKELKAIAAERGIAFNKYHSAERVAAAILNWQAFQSIEANARALAAEHGLDLIQQGDRVTALYNGDELGTRTGWGAAIALIETWLAERAEAEVQQQEEVASVEVSERAAVAVTREGAIACAPLPRPATATTCDPDVEFILALEEKIQRAAEVKPMVEVDFAGGVYRVWQSYHFLGQFYRDGKDWVAEPAFGQFSRHRTSNRAQAAIVRAWQR